MNESVSYGYLWRSRQVGSIRHYYGMGYAGQYLLVVPGLNMVVAANHDWQVSHGDHLCHWMRYDTLNIEF
ncbi:MAG TPA: hypothetical protein VJ821_12780 [Anaerolineales bacterium]|nr:hypothetical protein [Anaerolineales bacterium]